MKIKSNSLAFSLKLTDRSDLFEDELASLFSTNFVDPPLDSSTPSIKSQRRGIDTTLNTVDLNVPLNWATSDNPRGFSIIPPVQDQVNLFRYYLTFCPKFDRYFRVFVARVGLLQV